MALLFNVERVIGFLAMGTLGNNKNKSDQDLEIMVPIVLDEVQVEFQRLLQHPELFPDEVRPSFLGAMKRLFRQVSDWLAMNQANEEEEYLKYQEELKDHWRKILPNFDDNRTLWQQFLHGQAPGSGIPKDQMPSQGYTQLLTSAGFFMVTNKKDEYVEYAQSLREAREQRLPPRQVSNELHSGQVFIDVLMKLHSVKLLEGL
ncbi:MAG: hypothetical protein Q9219_003050 [cf. Caloplaca sp. 3 TL-2023]